RSEALYFILPPTLFKYYFELIWAIILIISGVGILKFKNSFRLTLVICCIIQIVISLSYFIWGFKIISYPDFSIFTTLLSFLPTVVASFYMIFFLLPNVKKQFRGKKEKPKYSQGEKEKGIV
ncbi:MAG: hypothetical protein ABIF87_03315, partial [Pseudomonadota bacterium]